MKIKNCRDFIWFVTSRSSRSKVMQDPLVKFLLLSLSNHGSNAYRLVAMTSESSCDNRQTCSKGLTPLLFSAQQRLKTFQVLTYVFIRAMRYMKQLKIDFGLHLFDSGPSQTSGRDKLPLISPKASTFCPVVVKRVSNAKELIR